ncbi:DUF4194 domain-containing protein [Chitinispirillales bacterium ANBcel5]|uniref:DUF4194 domain-containing protein n=1 Tax=Cellulosispirillum alkaliphilum TaxID=3039283 RepID=UPI002A58D4A3|nr:DUF4194 domain-containing protein [Chitinispirillales bacterium ANBcel5]
MSDQTQPDKAFSRVMINLLKGVIYAEEEPKLWQQLLNLQARVRDYAKQIGLSLEISEEEGFAWLKTIDEQEEGEEMPRLISRRQLSYPVSLLLALLRRRLAEHDATSSDNRLILSKNDVIEMITTFLPSGSNEVKIVNQVESYLKKIADMGFIRYLRSDKDTIEVRRILKVFIDAQWLNEFDLRIKEYLLSGRGAEDE